MWSRRSTRHVSGPPRVRGEHGIVPALVAPALGQPRMRGERYENLYACDNSVGPPPRARGAPPACHGDQGMRRTTPACAGENSPTTTRSIAISGPPAAPPATIRRRPSCLRRLLVHRTHEFLGSVRRGGRCQARGAVHWRSIAARRKAKTNTAALTATAGMGRRASRAAATAAAPVAAEMRTSGVDRAEGGRLTDGDVTGAAATASGGDGRHAPPHRCLSWCYCGSVNFCAPLPLQSQICIWMPGVVEPFGSSRHLLACGL